MQVMKEQLYHGSKTCSHINFTLMFYFIFHISLLKFSSLTEALNETTGKFETDKICNLIIKFRHGSGLINPCFLMLFPEIALYLLIFLLHIKILLSG